MKAPCKKCGVDEPDHDHGCPLRVALRDTVAHALILAYRDARREGIDPCRSFFVRGILRELDALYPRASWDPPPEHDQKASSS